MVTSVSESLPPSLPEAVQIKVFSVRKSTQKDRDLAKIVVSRVIVDGVRPVYVETEQAALNITQATGSSAVSLSDGSPPTI